MAERQPKAPAFQWYPGDARRDTALQSCGLHARGLWREMLDLMHDGSPYGHLAIEGRSIGTDALARMVGERPAVIRKLLAELETAAVFSRTEDGIIYSRRMVRDERVRRARAAGGHASIHHPTVAARMKGPEKDGPKDTLPRSFDPSPSSAVFTLPPATAVETAVDVRGDVERARVLRLPKDHLGHAACSPDLACCVPEAVHGKLRGLLAPRFGGDTRQTGDALKAWYGRVWASLPARFVPPSDAFRFWGPRFDAEFATPSETPKAIPVPTGPAAWRGCSTHQPPCQSSSEHSRRELAALRAKAK